MVERFCPRCVDSLPISLFDFIAPLPLKIAPKEVILPTLRTTDLK